MGTFVILDLLGGVSLLLWGLHMVQSGILRAFGPDLRHLLGKALANRFSAFATGLGLTTVLQSSTATALMTSSFVRQGIVDLVPALAVLLGANVGTTLIVQLLSFNIVALAPALFLIGVVAFRTGGRHKQKDLGRVSIGLGLVLLALHTLLDTLAPAESAPTMRILLAAITGDPILCVLLAAGLTWAAHSSVATVLLAMSLAYSNFVTPTAALALVLGANLGSAINPLLEGVQRGDATSYRLPVGNLANRIAGIILALPVLPLIASALHSFQPDAAKMTAEFHLIFNVVLAAIFLAILDPLARLLERLFPAAKTGIDIAAPRYLDEAALATPSLALADAARETLRMGDFVEDMLRKVMEALHSNDRELVREVSRMDNIVDRLDEAIRLYLTRLTRGSLDDREGRRAMEIISFAINLEHVGDIIDKNLSELATKKIKRRLQFSAEGREELSAFHKRILDSLKRALNVFMTGDVGAARALIAEKAELRATQLSAAEHHLERLRDGEPESLETTSIHLDILRDLKRIHSHICAVGYPILAEATVRETEGVDATVPDRGLSVPLPDAGPTSRR